MKIKTFFLTLLMLLLITMITGCSIIRNSLLNEQEIINKIENHYVEYSTTISVEDIETALTTASSIGKGCTVGISVTTQNIVGGKVDTGSGVILKKEQLSNSTYKYLVVTNRHVIGTKSNVQVSVYLGDNIDKYIKATYIAYDELYDLAIIEFTTGILLNVATINQTELKAGQYAIAIGSPYDLEAYYNSVTVGAISSPSRICDDEGANGAIYQHTFIQHTAVLNSGNSGGGLYDIKGQLIGINTFKIVGDSGDHYEGLNFSIPIKTVLERFKKYL